MKNPNKLVYSEILDSKNDSFIAVYVEHCQVSGATEPELMVMSKAEAIEAIDEAIGWDGDHEQGDMIQRDYYLDHDDQCEEDFVYTFFENPTI